MIHQFSIYNLSFIILIWPIFAQNNRECSPSNDCLTLSRCAERLQRGDLERILFHCGDKKKVCCPRDRIPLTEVPRPTEPVHNANLPTKYHMSNEEYERQTESSANNCNSCGRTNKTGSPGSQFYRGTASTMLPGGYSNKDASLPVSSGNQSKNNTVPPNTRFASHKNFRLLPTKCGANDFPNRITEGEEADLGEFPWMALVGVKDNHGNLTWLCGGTLINHRYVLTAAHCIYRQNGFTPMVRLGEHNLENATDCDKINNFCLELPQDFVVEEIIVHEHWNSTIIKNDIALVRLPREVSESFSVSPICLPLGMTKRNSSEDSKYEVAGWGKTDWNALPRSNVLRKGTLSGISSNDCNLCKGKKKERYCPITSSQMCAQGYKSVDVCKGDSGGPLMMAQERVYQVGITSFKSSEHCGADNIPSVFTRVESYLEWILNNIRE